MPTPSPAHCLLMTGELIGAGSSRACHLNIPLDTCEECTSLSCFLLFQKLLPLFLFFIFGGGVGVRGKVMFNSVDQWKVSSWGQGEHLEKNMNDCLVNQSCLTF